MATWWSDEIRELRAEVAYYKTLCEMRSAALGALGSHVPFKGIWVRDSAAMAEIWARMDYARRHMIASPTSADVKSFLADPQKFRSDYPTR